MGSLVASATSYCQRSPAHLIFPIAVFGPVPTTTARALPAVMTVPCNTTSTVVCLLLKSFPGCHMQSLSSGEDRQRWHPAAIQQRQTSLMRHRRHHAPQDDAVRPACANTPDHVQDKGRRRPCREKQAGFVLVYSFARGDDIRKLGDAAALAREDGLRMPQQTPWALGWSL